MIGYRHGYAYAGLIKRLIVSCANGACFLSRLRARTIISKFQGFNALESTGPAVVESEGLGEGLTNDVACLVGKKELWIKGNDLDAEGGALGGELRIESFQMKEDCLFSFLQFLCTLAENGDNDEMFWLHNNTILDI